MTRRPRQCSGREGVALSVARRRVRIKGAVGDIDEDCTYSNNDDLDKKKFSIVKYSGLRSVPYILSHTLSLPSTGPTASLTASMKALSHTTSSSSSSNPNLAGMRTFQSREISG